MHRFEILHTVGDVAAADWDRLITIAGAPVFYRHDLVAGYEDSALGGQRVARYLVARDGAGALAAALPLYLLDAREIFAILGTEGFAGSASRALLTHFPHCYDTTVPVVPGVGGITDGAGGPDTLLVALWEAMLAESRRQGASLVGFFNVAADSPLAAALPAVSGVAAGTCGARYYLEPSTHGGLDDLLATMARATRRTLRLARNRAVAAGASTDWQRGPGQDLEDVVGLCAATAAKHGNNYYPAEPLRRFLGSLGDRLLVIRVRLGGRTVAASVCLHDGDVLHCWAGGSRYPKVLNWSPNYVLFHAELTLAFELGVKRAEFGRGNHAFKARHRLSRLPLVSYLREL